MPHAVPVLSTAILILTIALVALIWWQLSGPVYRAVDGDTIDDVTNKIRYRIENIDTPETGSRAKSDKERMAGEEAKRRLQDLLQQGDIKVIPGKRKLDKYGRHLARIEIDGRDVGEKLISEGLARPYAGGKRENWIFEK